MPKPKPTFKKCRKQLSTPADERKRKDLLARMRGDRTVNSAEDKFVWLVQRGAIWHEAVCDSGLAPAEAAEVVERMLQFRMDGLAVFLLSEGYLRQALEGLIDIAGETEDERIKIVALSKLADVSLKVLTNKPWIQKLQAFPLPQEAKDHYKGTTWDAAFEEE